MLPSELEPSHFARFPPEARAIALSTLPLLRQLPLCFEPLLLRELLVYDWKFPVERAELNHQLHYLASLSPALLRTEMEPFANFRLSADLARLDWVNAPAEFSQQLTAHLWATHQIDAFRTAALDYVRKLNASLPIDPLPIPRIAIVSIGQGVATSNQALFRKLRPHGTYFSNVEPANARTAITDLVTTRAAAHPRPFAHWYIDGGEPLPLHPSQVTSVSYADLQPACKSLQTRMRTIAAREGPEALRFAMLAMRPEDFGLPSSGVEAALSRFKLSLLTEGSGTQIFSTTFLQWTAREVLRRAQPLTLFARFAPRQSEQVLTEVVSGAPQHLSPDPAGSLVDADMGAYYTWLNLQRLPGASQSAYLVWFEGHRQALAIAPSLARATQSSAQISMPDLLARLAP